VALEKERQFITEDFVIELNVGGHVVSESRDVLTQCQGTLFDDMFSGVQFTDEAIAPFPAKPIRC
jgi:hypothetical protein